MHDSASHHDYATSNTKCVLYKWSCLTDTHPYMIGALHNTEQTLDIAQTPISPPPHSILEVRNVKSLSQDCIEFAKAIADTQHLL